MTIPISLLVTHFIGDFLFQSDWMALNKSKKINALFVHVTIYSACFLWLGWQFAAFTFWAHLLTDAVTSRITSALWFIELGDPYGTNLFDWAKVSTWKRHWFFVAIGADQLIHYITLAVTYKLVIGG